MRYPPITLQSKLTTRKSRRQYAFVGGTYLFFIIFHEICGIESQVRRVSSDSERLEKAEMVWESSGRDKARSVIAALKTLSKPFSSGIVKGDLSSETQPSETPAIIRFPDIKSQTKTS
jgi:hypothetical protein